MDKKILVIVGSTGGHYIPGTVLAENIRKILPSVQIIFAGEKKLKDLEIWKTKCFPFIPIPVIKRPKKIRIFFFPFRFMYVLLYSFILINRQKPQLIVGMGSYTTIVPILTGIILKQKIIIHEQNYVPGLTTKILNFFGAPVALTFPETKKYLLKKRFHITGLPVREEFYSGDKISLNNSGLKENKTTILVTGGSQGAKFINDLIVQAISLLDPLKYQIIHITGKKDFERVKEFYKKSEINSYVLDFSLKIYDFFKSSDIIISRCGAGTIAEITSVKKPAILIPFRFAEGHQLFNAKYCEEKGACIVMEEKNTGPLTLFHSIETIKANIEKFKSNFENIKISDTEGNFAKLCIEKIRK
ncbi:MAG: UDP-N-acetylglucosamine--N-acetylmuramyl-(pentapeptide) pyrophosphoryl-undecaprenol N-acetylglucosamine transferase [Candidatus Omnitrophica bacterium]|nr:UDP-N-acetylglucosamine--N-acetylmuramyl-(pentapeptide) pyrophosphoryl-undecaprenol N-acetylglucosamine transferase [Candidatus Omnitrophota bacterium]